MRLAINTYQHRRLPRALRRVSGRRLRGEAGPLRLVKQLLWRAGRAVPPPQVDLVAAVDEARRDYRAAQAYFQTVSEKELVDQAIHLVSAAEKRLLFLLRKVSEDGAAEGLAAGRRQPVP